MISMKKQKIWWAVVAGVMALFLVGTVLAEGSDFFGTAMLAAETPVGAITVSAVDEATRTIPVSTIETNKGTIRMIATVTPTDAANKKVVWTIVNKTGAATCDVCGQLFPVANGIVTAVATSAVSPSIMGQEDITISNQFEGIDLKTAANYTILASAAITAAGTTTVTGDIGVSPIAAAAITGFSLVHDSSEGFATSSYVSGKVYAADYASTTPATLSTAVGDMGAAYTTGMGLVPPVETELYGGDLSGQTLRHGIYKWSNTVLINGTLTLSGSPTDFWVFQISGGITQAAGTSITLSGGARAENVFWLSALTIALGADSHFTGIALGQTNIAVGADCVVNGRLLAQTDVSLGVGSIINYPSYVV